jgi:radical SAM-linked protein
MRVFERAIRRSGIPIRYSSGFNPHADMVFGLPLQVGVTADAECLDIGLIGECGSAWVMDVINTQLPPGLIINDCVIKKVKDNAMAQITHAKYIMGVDSRSEIPDNDIKKSVCEMLSEAVNLFNMPGTRVVTKKTKKATCEVDIAPLIKSIAARGRDIVMTVSAGSKDNVKPDMVLDALNDVYFDNEEYNGGDPDARKNRFYRTSLHRTGIYIERGGVLLSPLGETIINNSV